jgi:hypothetical protein
MSSVRSSSTELGEKRKVVVVCQDGKRIQFLVTRKETFGELNERVRNKSNLLRELSCLYIGEKEVNESRTMDEMDVSDGCVIVQKMSPLANLLKPDTLTPSVLSSIVEYVENVELWTMDRILTNSLFGKIGEVMKRKYDIYYPIVTILTSIGYRHAVSGYPAYQLYDPMEECGIVKMLQDDCEKALKSEI